MGEVSVTFELEGRQINAEVDYTVTSWGSSGCGPSLSYPGDPPEPPEWDLNSIKTDAGVEFNYDDLPEKVQELIVEAVYEQLAEGPDDEPYDPEPY